MARSITVNLSSPDIINMTGEWTFNKYLKVSYSWSNAPSGMKSTVPIDSNKYKPGDMVSVDETYTNKTGYKGEESVDSTSATVNSTAYYWTRSAYGNGRFIMMTDSGKDVAYSTDNGNNWIKTTTNISLNKNKLIFANGKFYICTIGVVVYSTDGITWTKSSTIGSSSTEWYGIYYSGTLFTMCGYNTNQAAYSTDGITWTVVTISSTKRTWVNTCYGNGIYVIIAYNTKEHYHAYSTDGKSWTEKTNTLAHRFTHGIAFGNGRFLQTDGRYMNCSTDGINWDSWQSNVGTYTRSIVFGNGLFIITEAEYMSSNTFKYTVDGKTINSYITSPTFTSVRFYHAAFGNGVFIVPVYDNTMCLIINGKCNFYRFSGWNKSNFNITSDTSINGSWSTVSSSTGLTLVE